MDISIKEVNKQEQKLLKQQEKLSERKPTFVTIFQPCCLIPQRFVMGILCSFAMFNGYTMRLCLNLAITQMVNHTRTSREHFDVDACPSEDALNHVNGSTRIDNKPFAMFEWDEKSQGLLLGAFFYGYATTQLLGGVLSEKFGAKWVLGCGLFSTAVFTLLIPIVTRWGGFKALFALRVVQGIGEGPVVPSLMSIMAKWIPPHERAFQGALIFGGSHIGNVFGSILAGYLMKDGRDWADVFYFFGGLTLIWFIVWALLGYSSPDTHPFISQNELDYLNSKVLGNKNNNVASNPVPWKAIARSSPVWALVAANIGHDWGYYTIMTDLPKYSHDVLKFNITSTGYLTAIPYACLWIASFLFGIICDGCIKRGYHSIKTGRICHTFVATTGPAVCIILASFSGCNRTAAMAYFIVSMTLMGGFYSGVKVNNLDVAPNYAGTVSGIMNTFSTFAGFISPYVIGLLTPDSTLVQWRMAFWVCFAVMIVTNIIYAIWADGKPQWWDDVSKHGYPEGWLEKHGPLFADKVTTIENELSCKA